ncbi:DNA-directed RNA polymerase subunit omega [Kytococcus sedentarius]|uniref:DNA-directed RNA polymerase subunit omega n=1 Tax=Kytococcus sedentarius TaxID=1276 RepID=UPI00384EA778
MSGTKAAPIGVTNPPIDDLLQHVDSKYALVIYSAKRARQINAYYAQLKEGLLEYVGPLVEAEASDKPLSIALKEINADKLVRTVGHDIPEVGTPGMPAEQPEAINTVTEEADEVAPAEDVDVMQDVEENVPDAPENGTDES